TETAIKPVGSSTGSAGGGVPTGVSPSGIAPSGTISSSGPGSTSQPSTTGPPVSNSASSTYGVAGLWTALVAIAFSLL
ncbi:hypothetical protein KEM56_004156, partial [Ascosphaera pollenicola]